jgi:hypothetical protein
VGHDRVAVDRRPERVELLLLAQLDDALLEQSTLRWMRAALRALPVVTSARVRALSRSSWSPASRT